MSLLVKFSADFQISDVPKSIKLTDLTDYVGEGLVTNNMELLIWIVSASGNTIFKNAG